MIDYIPAHPRIASVRAHVQHGDCARAVADLCIMGRSKRWAVLRALELACVLDDYDRQLLGHWLARECKHPKG